MEFPFDVFLSHRTKDKAVVRPLAERLRADRIFNSSQPSTFNSQPSAGPLNEDTTKYIQSQAEHHRKTSFKEEIETFLKKHGMEYVERDLG